MNNLIDDILCQVNTSSLAKSYVKSMVESNVDDLDWPVAAMVVTRYHREKTPFNENTVLQIMAWCKENLEGKVTSLAGDKIFGFELESDSILFKLVWG